ncbi:YraN family protein [Maribacter algicola]|uniref:UPF0102 protein DZC72_03590 n=1 Tax=Maribacter algicola TaxID=2498892 RepID=A0A426RKZ4_9FLAO|nr:YraN family protein [Maribacter algicola]RRQ49686.1 YraN family protein [Maribacter algicola]
MGKHNEFGKEGEEMAKNYLIKKGYKICYQNYRYLKGEIDIVARKDDILAIVEVRSRSSKFIENIAETVTQKKIKLLVATADHYVTSRELDVDTRFDIITIFKEGGNLEIEHLESAYYYF